MEFMISHIHYRVASFAVLVGLATLIGACQRVPLLAPSGSVITLVSTVTALPVNGSTDIIAQVIEPAGTPPQRGTRVSFTTTLGSIQPADAETDLGGRVIVKFLAGTGSGTATISAISGGAAVASSGALKILIGTAAVGSVRVSASPTLLPANGGSSTITAQALDVNGNPLSLAPMSFSTTAGTLDQGFVTTDSSGTATTILRTSSQATVTAAVGAQAGSTTPPATGTTPTAPTSGQASGTVTVNVSGAPTLVITPPTIAPTVGIPANFTFVVTASTTNGSAIRGVTVDWGDGQIQDLGVVTGTALVSHTYSLAKSYLIRATVTDSFGNAITTSTSVTVTSPVLTLTITPPTTASEGLAASFTFVPTVPANSGDAVRNVRVDWGDGTSVQDLGAISGSTTVSHVFANAQSYTVKGTLTDTFGNSITVSSFVTVIPVGSPTVNVTASVPTTPNPITTVTFTIQVTPPSGVGIKSATINYGDLQTDTLGGVNGTITKTHTYTHTPNQPFTATVTVRDTLDRDTTGTTTFNIP